MRRPSNRTLLLAAGSAAVLLAMAAVVTREGAPAGTGGAPSNRVSEVTVSDAAPPVADVRLELLQEPPVELADPERNPFRFRPPPAPPPPPRAAGPARPSPFEPPVPAGPPPPPPIPLRFIGLVDAPTQVGRVAILSDGRGGVFHAKEGDIIEGRYKVLRIGADAAELAYLDGRGRQAIRLSGQ